MFSSNQVLKVSGTLDDNQLEESLKFALKISGNLEYCTRAVKPVSCIYQITPGGRYCLGTTYHDEKSHDGWYDFPFTFDIHIMSAIIKQFLAAHPLPSDDFDGSYSDGFLMSIINFGYFPNFPDKDPDILVNPGRGFVYFERFKNYYAK